MSNVTFFIYRTRYLSVINCVDLSQPSLPWFRDNNLFNPGLINAQNDF